MYEFTQRCRQLYELLEDELSREVFKARLLFDLEPSMTNAMRLLCLNEASRCDGEKTAERMAWKKKLEDLEQAGQKLFLYGAGHVGSLLASFLLYENADFYGFCDRRADTIREFMGKPVFPPEYVFKHADESYVIVSVGDTAVESVEKILKENHFPESRILRYYDADLMDKQYFDFPALYRRGTAFINAGCFDCSTDIAFAKWCDGEYSKIIALEPDPNNYRVCLEKGKGIRDFELIQAGASDHSGTAEFFTKGSGASSICPPEQLEKQAGPKTSVRLTTIDEVAGKGPIGMIKMDIEGAEFSALLGAEKTIRRDKPLMALCVYHRPGDTIEFMDYLNKLVPGYRFWLRQYTGPGPVETVLYAAVDSL